MRYLLSMIALCAAGLGWSGAAHAHWREASSPHFVVYANESKSEITRFSRDLEIYHHAMELVTAHNEPTPSPSNRLTVFVVSTERKVQKLYGDGARYVGGFYMPSAGNSIAIVPRVHVRRGQQDYSMIALLHEYAHHFLISQDNLPLPRWLSEGAAEFFASSEFPGKGGIKIGMPAYQRAGELYYAKDVPVEKLLAADAYENGATKGFDSFYGKSWLLYHHLTLGDKKRSGQLLKYVRLMAKGEDSLQAGRDAFGDLHQLDKDLDRYLDQRRMFTFAFPPEQFPESHIAVRELSDGEAEIMPELIRTRRGVSPEEAKEVLEEVHKVAAEYPKDPAVLAELSEAECDAGHDDKAIAAADAALALDPKRVRAYEEKGRALFDEAEKTDGDKAAAYQKALAPFIALNRLENDNPLPLIYYFRSFAERGVKPPKQAVLGLTRAAELAPYDLDLRLMLAEYQLDTGDLADARRNLVPIAYDPHATATSAGARTLIQRIDNGKPPDAKETAQIIADSIKAATAAAAGDQGDGGKG